MSRDRARAMYRVYSEEEYLSASDLPPTSNGVICDDAGGGRALRRLAGATALSGALGTLAVAIGFAVSHEGGADHPAAAAEGGSLLQRQIASGVARASAPPRELPPRGRRTLNVAPPKESVARPTRRGPAKLSRPSTRMQDVGGRGLAAAGGVASAPHLHVVVAPASAPGAPVSVRVPPAAARSEFGFERRDG